MRDDLFKINDTFFRDPYCYKYGILVSIGKLPKELPAFDKDRVGILEIYGWGIITEEEFAEQQRNQKLLDTDLFHKSNEI